MNQHKFKKSAIVLVAVAIVMLASNLDAVEIDGAYFKERLDVNNTTLKLTGAGLLRRLILEHMSAPFIWKRGVRSTKPCQTEPNGLNYNTSDRSRAKTLGRQPTNRLPKTLTRQP